MQHTWISKHALTTQPILHETISACLVMGTWGECTSIIILAVFANQFEMRRRYTQCIYTVQVAVYRQHDSAVYLGMVVVVFLEFFPPVGFSMQVHVFFRDTWHHPYISSCFYVMHNKNVAKSAVVPWDHISVVGCLRGLTLLGIPLIRTTLLVVDYIRLSSEDGSVNVSICGRDSDVARAYVLWGGRSGS